MEFGNQTAATSEQLSEEELQILLKEVEEQLGSCDVTIKVGEWKKKFHWSVLSSSPFFEACHRHDFIEKRTDTIDLTQVTSCDDDNKDLAANIEDTLLFLYGKHPNISMGNIYTLLEMSEFLLIPSLKDTCVHWLKSDIQITADNFFTVYELDIDFRLELIVLNSNKKYTLYLKSHLIELLNRDESVMLEKEVLLYLLRDPTLTYVTERIWFRYLVRWSSALPSREKHFSELFSLLNLYDIDEDLLQTITEERLVKKLCHHNKLLKRIQPSSEMTRKVLIFPKYHFRLNSPCFRLKKRRWCNLDQGYLERESWPILAVKDKDSAILYRRKLNAPNIIIIHDLENKIWTETKLVYDGLDCIDLEAYAVQLFVAKSVCFAALTFKSGTCSLYKGELDILETAMKPLVTLRIPHIEHFAMDTFGNVAMLSTESRYLHVYNDNHGTLRQILLNNNDCISQYVSLFAYANGFLLISSFQMCHVSFAIDQSVRDGYTIMHADLPDLDGSKKIIVDGDMTICYSRPTKSNAAYTFQYTTDDIFCCEDREIKWQTMEHSRCGKRGVGQHLGSTAFLITLPKTMLNCGLNCPHCELS